MKRLHLLLALAALLPACGGPIVAPLRYEALPPLPEEPFRAAVPDASPVPPSIALPFQVSTLPNGLKLAVLPRHGLPIVSVQLVSERGSADAAASFDTYAILHRVMEGGTADHNMRELSLAWARLGAPRRAFFWDDACGLAARAAAPDLDAALSLLAETATRPRLGFQNFADARTTWFQDFANGSFAARTSVARNVASLVFGKAHPYGFARPTRAHAEALRPDDLAALHARLFHPALSTLILVGDVTPEAALASATRAFGGWSTAVPPLPRAARPDLPPPGPRLVFITRRESRQVDATVVALGPEATAADVFALEILARVLGGASSRLRGEVRVESGAAYNFGAGVFARRHASMLTITGALDREKAVPALRSILAALAEVRSAGVREADFERARTSLLSGWRTQIATADGLATLAAVVLSDGQTLEAVGEYPARLQAVTREDVRRVAQQWLREDALHVVVSGAAGVLPELLALGLGEPAHRDVWGDPARR